MRIGRVATKPEKPSWTGRKRYRFEDGYVVPESITRKVRDCMADMIEQDERPFRYHTLFYDTFAKVISGPRGIDKWRFRHVRDCVQRNISTQVNAQRLLEVKNNGVWHWIETVNRAEAVAALRDRTPPQPLSYWAVLLKAYYRANYLRSKAKRIAERGPNWRRVP